MIGHLERRCEGVAEHIGQEDGFLTVFARFPVPLVVFSTIASVEASTTGTSDTFGSSGAGV